MICKCLKCEKIFESRHRKKYCNMNCYKSSAQFVETQKKAIIAMSGKESREKTAKALTKKKEIKCLNCNKVFLAKLSKIKNGRKFCSRICYRTYMAERFDRWIANPEKLNKLPQCFDEFLDQDELHCLVVGCNWVGQYLSLHMNQTHGVSAIQFKKMVGFNLKTGVIGKKLSIMLSKRENVGVALTCDKNTAINNGAVEKSKEAHGYKSLEGKEHFIKSKIIYQENYLNNPDKLTCINCGKEFFKKNYSGIQKYCSFKCRSKYYYDRNKMKGMK